MRAWEHTRNQCHKRSDCAPKRSSSAWQNHPVLQAQKALGNQAVLRMLASPDQRASQRAEALPSGQTSAGPLVQTLGLAGERSGLAALAHEIDRITEVVRGYSRHQNVPPPPGRVTEAGETHCDPELGRPVSSIRRTLVPRCMWSCAEVHERTHAEFMRGPCEDFSIAFWRARFWLHVARQFQEQNNGPEMGRALSEAERAAAELRQALTRYLNYMSQTCRYDEGEAYNAGIQACDTPEARSRCAATGETDEYNRQLAFWRRAMTNPPNCPPVSR